MGDREDPHTCLSDDSKHNVRHFELHYFGCLREEDKDRYFCGLKSEEQTQIRDTEAKITRVLKEIHQEEAGSSLIQDIKELRRRFFKKPAPLTNGNQPFTERTPAHGQLSDTPSSTHSSIVEEQCHGYEMSASIILLDPKSPQHFEELKVSVHDLDGTSNPIREPCPIGRFRYFHLPHNNMKWVMVSNSFEFGCIGTESS